MALAEFFEISGTRSVLTEIESDLTERQLAQLQRNVTRWEQYGWQLDGSFFSRVQGASEKLYEFRLTLDRVEYRLLFAEEITGTFVVLAAYKERRNAVPRSKVDSAEQRLAVWRERQQAKKKADHQKGQRGR